MYIIYTISNCKYCELAKELLNGIEKIIIKCDDMINDPIRREEFIYSINNKMGYPIISDKITFPLIFLDDAYIGGYHLLKEHLETDNMLKSYYIFQTNCEF